MSVIEVGPHLKELIEVIATVVFWLIALWIFFK